MRTTRLSELADRVGSRFPAKKLAVGLVLLCTATAVFALVDRVAPPAAPPPKASQPPSVEKASPEKAAADKTAPAAARKAGLAPESPLSAGPLLVMGGMLAGAVGLIFVLKRVLRGSRHVPGGKKLLKVRDVLAIGPKRAIYLIGLEHRNLVVGLSGDQLSLLSEYSEEAESAASEPAPLAQDGRTAEVALPAAASEAEAAFAARPTMVSAPAPARVDAVVGGEVTVPPAEPVAPPPRAAAAAPRSFPFAAVDGAGARDRKPRADRVPHKFRQLLEQAAGPEGSSR